MGGFERDWSQASVVLRGRRVSPIGPTQTDAAHLSAGAATFKEHVTIATDAATTGTVNL